MKVIMAESAGFCFGVKGAVEKVFDHAQKGEKLTVLGQLIHNRHISRDLEEAGVGSIDSIADADVSEKVVIRTHGATKGTYTQLEDAGFEVMDATCPYVTNVQVVAQNFEKKGYNVVLFGERGHPEVKSIVSYLEEDYHIVETLEEAELLPWCEKYALVSQTTQDKSSFPLVLDVVKSKCQQFQVNDTICNATELRQNSAIELAKTVDTMVVIGGMNSGNTLRLVSTCQQHCLQVYHIESVDDLSKYILQKDELVGVTAGASTPDYIINEVVTFLEGV